MSRKITIEIEEHEDKPPCVRVFADGEQLGVLSNVKLEADFMEAWPSITAGVLPDWTEAELATCSPKLREALSKTIKTLRGFQCVTVEAPEGL